MPKRIFLAAVVLSGWVIGCNAMNDNPVSADKMQQIRASEAQGRQNFHPSGGSPGGPPPPNTPTNR